MHMPAIPGKGLCCERTDFIVLDLGAFNKQKLYRIHPFNPMNKPFQCKKELTRQQ
jgi:hypothetical protein